MKLTPELKSAIKGYFAAKYHDGTGWFKNDGSKERVLRELNEVCIKLNYGLMVVPGTIFITTSKDLFRFERSNWWIGKRVVIKT